MYITLTQLFLENFKGIKELNVIFSPVTNISGDNGTGKTTLFDAFTWLLFGKDSHDSKDFEIKTLDSSNRPIPQIDHTVEGVLNIDGKGITLKRTYREKWTRRRGADASELTGHETLYFIDGAPVQAKEYQSRIQGIVAEDLFKLFTSATYFNSIPWKDRREILVKLAGQVNKEAVLNALPEQQRADVGAILASGRKFDEERAVLASEKKKCTDELAQIPGRIDEVRRGMPQEEDWEKLETDLGANQTLLTANQSAIEDQVAAHKTLTDEAQKKQTEVYELRRKLQDIEETANSQATKAYWAERTSRDELLAEGSRVKTRREKLEKEAEGLEKEIASIEEELSCLRKNWETVNAEQFTLDSAELVCPTCQRPLDENDANGKKTELLQHFSKNKSKSLADINSKGQLKAQSLAIATSRLNTIREELSEIVLAEVSTDVPVPVPPVPINPITLPGYPEIQSKITKLELQLTEIPPIDIAGLKEDQLRLQEEISVLNSRIAKHELIVTAKARVDELLARESELAQMIAGIERKMFAMENYTKIYMDKVEDNVNDRFQIARWKMFRTQLNGGMEPICECLVNGVPYSDINSAAKIQVGIDCINTLSDHFETWAPIWVDNRESTNRIPDTKSQVINLYVTKDPKLVIA
jgi:chromosome segregation ATPase